MNNFNESAGNMLRSFIERIERVNEDLVALNGDKKEIYSEAKAVGFDVKVMKVVIRRRAMCAQDRRELDQLTETYMRAIETSRACVREEAAE